MSGPVGHDPHLDVSSRHPRRTERAIAASFIVATLAGVGLAVTYWFGGQTQLEGAMLFVSLGGLGFGVTLWGKALMPQGPFEQERANLIGSAEDQEAFKAAFVRGEESFESRRNLLRLFLGGVGAVGVALLFPIRSLGPNPGRTLFQTQWRPGSRMVDTNGRRVGVTTLEVGGAITVFPEGFVGTDDSQTILIRPSTTPVVTRPGREDWSPDGYLAYSKLCTHAGCPVGLYEHERKQLLCPCHQSTFNVLQGAQPAFGPATRPLPQLPIMVDDQGNFVSQSDYTEPVGPGFWNRGRASG